MLKILIYILVLIGCIIVTISDIKKQKISNKVTLSLGIAGLLINIFLGKEYFINSLIACIGIFVFFFIMFMIKVRISFGDIKLYMAIGACVGYEGIIFILITSCILSILYRLFLRMDKIKDTFKNIKCIWIDLRVNKKITHFYSSTNKFPMAPFILIGTILFIGVSSLGIL